MYGCQQHLITTTPENIALLEFICSEANKLTNCGIYYCRQILFKAARLVINWCLKNQVSNIVFGWNQGNKDGINIGKKNNQEFVQIPTARLKNRIAQLCEQHSIKFIETEESYTSKASFLDNDFLPTFGAKPEGWNASGKRVKRGLYQDSQGRLINADCNGAANILRKAIQRGLGGLPHERLNQEVATQLGLSLAEVGRASLNVPQRYTLDCMSRDYRKRCEAWFSTCETTTP